MSTLTRRSWRSLPLASPRDAADDDHVADCADCQSELERLTGGRPRPPNGHLSAAAAAVWSRSPPPVAEDMTSRTRTSRPGRHVCVRLGRGRPSRQPGQPARPSPWPGRTARGGAPARAVSGAAERAVALPGWRGPDHRVGGAVAVAEPRARPTGSSPRSSCGRSPSSPSGRARPAPRNFGRRRRNCWRSASPRPGRWLLRGLAARQGRDQHDLAGRPERGPGTFALPPGSTWVSTPDRRLAAAVQRQHAPLAHQRRPRLPADRGHRRGQPHGNGSRPACGRLRQLPAHLPTSKGACPPYSNTRAAVTEDPAWPADPSATRAIGPAPPRATRRARTAGLRARPPVRNSRPGLHP